MRFFFLLFSTAVIAYFALMVMPWWIPMLIAFALVLLVPVKNWQAFFATAIGAGLSYFLIALMADQANEHILSRKMAVLFGLPSYGFIIAVTALSGFVTAGLGGWTAAALRNLFQTKKLKETESAIEEESIPT